MLTGSYSNIIEVATVAQQREALLILLRPHIEPVFGAAKTVEHEVAAFNALKVLGYVGHDADEFDLVEKLRITKSKARSLLYQTALRSGNSQADIDEALRKALMTTRAVREGTLYLIEVPDPLTMDRLRKRVRNYGFLSDGSFSGAIAKVPEGALVRLMEDLISDEHKADIRRQLVKAGMPDRTVAGVIKAMLSTAAKKAAGELGDQTATAIGDELGRVLRIGWEALKSFVDK